MPLVISSVDDRTEWNDLVARLPGRHLLQSWEWGELKAEFGWQVERLIWRKEGVDRAAAQILRRSEGPFSIEYCPRGPVLDWGDATLRAHVLTDLQYRASRRGIIFIKIDPDLPLGFGPAGAAGSITHPPGQAAVDVLAGAHWRPSREQVQFRNTFVLDLSQTEGELLGGMRSKTRYNIRLAERSGVQVRLGDAADLELLYTLYAETSLRDGFVIREPAYYREAWGSFIAAGLAQPFVAEIDSQAVAAIVVYRFADRAWYLYGMSRAVYRERMPNHLLQWEAIRWAKQQNCTAYDLWGAPDVVDESDPLWGVYRFKQGFGATFVRTIGAWDYTSRPPAYWAYTAALPRLLAVMRRRGRAATRRSLES